MTKKPIVSRKRARMNIRTASVRDIDDLLKLEKVAWSEEAQADMDTYKARLEVFPEGIFIGERDGNIEGAAVTQIINSECLGTNFTWESITDNGKIIKTHNPTGDALYGVNLSVKPKCIGNDLVCAIMMAIARMIIERNLKFGVLGGRIPGLSKYIYKRRLDADFMNKAARDNIVSEYVFGKTKYGRPLDPEIALYQRLGLTPIRILDNYFPDPPSLNYGVLLLWINPYYSNLIYKKLGITFGKYIYRLNRLLRKY